MALSLEDLHQQRARFDRRTAEFADVGFDRLGAPEFIIDQAGTLDRPVLDIGTGMGITARALAGRGLDVVSVDTSADDQQVAAYLTDDPELSRHITYQVAEGSTPSRVGVHNRRRKLRRSLAPAVTRRPSGVS
jgi:2-polyprenyl-3-methyl-5-hydroxy-6-metoxy-1,4-benzoquinol methylase